MASDSVTARQLRVIRLALVAGVTILGGIVFYMIRTRSASLAPPASLNTLRLAFSLLTFVTLGAVTAVRMLQSRTADPGKRTALPLVGWAVAEAPALLGAIIWLVTRHPGLYIAGVLILLALFVILPVTEEA